MMVDGCQICTFWSHEHISYPLISTYLFLKELLLTSRKKGGISTN